MGKSMVSCKFSLKPIHWYVQPCRNGVREYVHRIGRTGRAGREGFAVTLLDEHEGDFRHCKDITQVLEASEQETPRWMVEESYSHKKHLQTYWRRQDQLRPEFWVTRVVLHMSQVQY